MARQPTSCSLKRGLLEAHTVLSRPVTPPFHEIEKWSISKTVGELYTFYILLLN
jgi:hypothetical protein